MSPRQHGGSVIIREYLAQWRRRNAVVCKTTMHGCNFRLRLKGSHIDFGFYLVDTGIMTGQYHSRKYTLNEEFFSEWSATMAYVLGFWYADGYMRHEKSYRVLFYSNDRDHLAQVANVMKSNSPIKDVEQGVDCGELCLHSKKLFYDLKRLGGKRRKSTSLILPDVPPIYFRDFLRGYFDGDGSVHFIS